MTIRIAVKYPAGHSSQEPWKPTEYFCPCCGKKQVWNCCNGGDYYAGESFLCIGCEAEWSWPSEPSHCSLSDADIYRQRLDQIRAAAALADAGDQQ